MYFCTKPSSVFSLMHIGPVHATHTLTAGKHTLTHTCTHPGKHTRTYACAPTHTQMLTHTHTFWGEKEDKMWKTQRAETASG